MCIFEYGVIKLTYPIIVAFHTLCLISYRHAKCVLHIETINLARVLAVHFVRIRVCIYKNSAYLH